MTELKPRKSLFNPEVKRRGIYVLPNLFTTAALFAGFFAIVQAMQGDFERAAMAIFIAMVLDGLDGRVARLTNTQSAFGAEYDSLSDMVSFGAAPALVMYEWALRDMGRLGWIAAFIYCACAALRLARFNTTLEVMDKRFFQGLPSPAHCSPRKASPSTGSFLAAAFSLKKTFRSAAGSGAPSVTHAARSSGEMTVFLNRV